MISIQLYNTLAQCGLERFDKNHYQVGDFSQPDAILLRSHLLEEAQVPASVKAVARAGAGTNNIPVEALTTRGIPVFNTPGANANAVKELVIAGMLCSARNLCQAWAFSQNLSGEPTAFLEKVEQGKKQFKGLELPGRTLGVIGLGAIGVKVANAALALGMRVIGYDPAITVKRAWELSAQVEQSLHLDTLLEQSDFITLHVPLMPQTQHLIDADRLAHVRPQATLLNFARAEIVDEAALKLALSQGRLGGYVSDFPSPLLQGLAKVITFPHLGASTEEAEDHCAVMAVEQLIDFLEQGQIRNAVNFPEVYLPRQGSVRLCIVNANVPNMVGQISSLLGANQLNIIEMVNKSRQDIAYTLIDVNHAVPPSVLDQINAITGILNTRVIT